MLHAFIASTCTWTDASPVAGTAGRLWTSSAGTGYGRTARHKTGAGALQREGIQAAGIPSRREENELMPDADDRPGDIYVTTAAACSDAAFSSAAFDFTVHGEIPYSGQTNALPIRAALLRALQHAMRRSASSQTFSAGKRRWPSFSSRTKASSGSAASSSGRLAWASSAPPDLKLGKLSISYPRSGRADLINRPRHAAARSFKR